MMRTSKGRCLCFIALFSNAPQTGTMDLTVQKNEGSDPTKLTKARQIDDRVHMDSFEIL